MYSAEDAVRPGICSTQRAWTPSLVETQMIFWHSTGSAIHSYTVYCTNESFRSRRSGRTRSTRTLRTDSQNIVPLCIIYLVLSRLTYLPRTFVFPLAEEGPLALQAEAAVGDAHAFCPSLLKSLAVFEQVLDFPVL